MRKKIVYAFNVSLCALAALAVIGGCSESQPGNVGDGASEQALVEPGKKTYTRFCFSCHASGVAGAPRVGDTVAWAPRLEKGAAKMLELVIQGMPPGMPARGMCMQCSDEELADALEFMLQKSQ